MIRAVLFDLDGTLIQSLNFWTEMNTKFLSERYGIAFDKNDNLAFRTMDFREISATLKEKYGLPEPLDAVIEARIKMAEGAYRRSLKPVPQAAELIKKIDLRRCRLAVATLNSTRLAKAALKNLGVESCFSLILGTENLPEGMRHKPAPDIYLHAARVFNLSPEECFVFEDSTTGLAAARAAGMPSCAVIHMEDDNDNYKDGKEAVVRKLEELSSCQTYGGFGGAMLIPALQPLLRASCQSGPHL